LQKPKIKWKLKILQIWKGSRKPTKSRISDQDKIFYKGTDKSSIGSEKAQHFLQSNNQTCWVHLPFSKIQDTVEPEQFEDAWFNPDPTDREG
jgi:Reverse transcriptase (RNA-dependent DNA polymerase)